ncbi:autotransporter-associated beta strand repeat-containing protein [Bosea sp. (in: a-proteobacteria)]|uniref:autotransporter-associated beta strand repeat-containing protein n=1 Tax=Bosea sp. (in: a-proteobacteria) TaxID=1871050 RepID=UPI002E0EC3BD
MFFYGTSASGNNVTYNLLNGNIQFRDNSVGGLSRFNTGSSGQLALFDTANAVTLGSLSGGGIVSNQSVSDKTLTIGGLNESTTFSGVIQTAGANGTLAVVKEGTGTLTLTGANTYAGGTTISAGTLQIGNGGTTGSVTGNVVNDDALVFNRSDSVTYGSVISGSGSVTQSGGGTLILTNTNSYTGGTTITTGSTLQVGNGGTTGTLGTGAITNDGVLAYNFVSIGINHTVTDTISGTGSLNVIGGGIILTGTNTYSGTTTIAANSGLAIGNHTSTGTLGTGAVVNGGELVVARTNRHVISNDISGSGALRQRGNGTAVLTGTNTYTGATTIDFGRTLQVGDGGTTGTLGTGAVTNNGTLAFDRTDSPVVSNAITGSGSLTQTGSGTLILTGANGYTGPTTIAAGSTLQLGNGGTTGSLGSGAVTNNGVLTVNRNTLGGPLTLANAIGGTGSLNVVSGGVYLTGANTYGGTTTIGPSGGIQVGAGGTTGSLGTGAVTNDGLLYLNRSNTHIVSNAISGSGELRQLGAGTAILTGNNTRTGITTIDSGRTLQVGDGGTTGTLGTGMVNNAGTLVFNRTGQVTQTGAISGSGTLRKEGAGELVLTGNHGYTGATTVNAGTLSVNGVLSASSQVTVNAGGTLGGVGTVTRTTINGGTLSPGNSVGTIAINGNLAFTPGSTYRAEIQGAAADQANVTGTASLAGTLQLVGLGGPYRFSSPYTLLSATGGLGGTRFDTIANPFGDGVIVTVGYTSGDVQLTLAPKPLTPVEPDVPPPPPPVVPVDPAPPTPTPPPAGPRIIGVTAPANAYAIAKSIDKAIANGGDPSSLFGIYNLPAASIPAAVNSLSGEIHSAAPAMAHIASDQFLRTMLDPMAAGRLEPGNAGPGAAAFSGLVRKGDDQPAAPSRLDAPFYSVWGSAYGSYGAADGNAAAGTAKRTVDSAHLATGLDIRLMPGTVAGIAVSGGKARASLPGVLGSMDADVFQAGLYGVTRLGPVKLGGALSYARLDNDVRRSIPALGSSLASSYDTTAWSGRLQASTTLLAWNGLSLSPLAALQATHARSPAVTEANWAGANAGALALTRRSDVTSRSELGLQLDADSVLAGVPVTGYVRAAWAHYFQRDAGLTASLVGLPGASFAATGAEIGRNSALLSAGVAAKLSERVSLGLNLDGELSDRGSRIGGSAQLRISF